MWTFDFVPIIYMADGHVGENAPQQFALLTFIT